MTEIDFPEEWEFLSFFEVEPVRDEPDEVWYYSNSDYIVCKDGIRLSFSVTPGHGDFTISLSHNEILSFQYVCLGMRWARFEKIHDGKVLTLCIDKPSNGLVEIRLKPSICVSIKHKNIG